MYIKPHSRRLLRLSGGKSRAAAAAKRASSSLEMTCEIAGEARIAYHSRVRALINKSVPLAGGGALLKKDFSVRASSTAFAQLAAARAEFPLFVCDVNLPRRPSATLKLCLTRVFCPG
jgi:hypothetical protein